MTSLPQPREEGKLPAPSERESLIAGAQFLEIAGPMEDLKKAKSRSEAREIMKAIAKTEHLKLDANGLYENTRHPAVILFIKTLNRLRKQEEALGHGALAQKTREKTKNIVVTANKPLPKPTPTQTAKPASNKQTKTPFLVTMPNGRTYHSENSFLDDIKNMERNARTELDWQKIEGLKHIYWDLLKQKFDPSNDLPETQTNKPKTSKPKPSQAPREKAKPTPKPALSETKPATQPPKKPKLVKDMDEDEIADLIVEAAMGISPNKEAEKHNQAVRQLSVAIKANPKLKIVARALSALADKKPELLLPKLTLKQAEDMLREATGVDDPELKAPKNLYDLVTYNIQVSDLESIAKKLNSILEKMKLSLAA